MNTFQYIVESIDGDYAHLRRIDEESDVNITFVSCRSVCCRADRSVKVEL